MKVMQIKTGYIEKEGVPFLPDGRVDMTACEWDGDVDMTACEWDGDADISVCEWDGDASALYEECDESKEK